MWIVLGLLWCPIQILAYAFAFSMLWAWFCIPLGMPSVSTAHAVGLISFVYLMRRTKEAPRDIDEAWIKERMSNSLIQPSLALFTGWIATLFL